MQVLKSRTIWAGLLEIVSGVALALSGELQQGGTLTLVGIVTIVLRAITKVPLSAK